MIFDSTKLIIDLDAIRHNIEAVKARVQAPVMAIIKADATAMARFSLPDIWMTAAHSSASARFWRRWSCGRLASKSPF